MWVNVKTLRILAILLLMLSCTCWASTEKASVSYGYYCGRGQTSYVGDIPVDYLDRACQYHDICVTALGMTDCYCSEQLYWIVSYVPTTTLDQQTMKDFILRGIYTTMLGCKNHDIFDVNYYVSGVQTDPNNKGFNYLPIYLTGDELYQGVHVICKTNNNLTVHVTDNRSTYYNITKTAYSQPSLVDEQFPHYVIDDDKPCLTFNYNSTDNLYIIVYNNHPYPAKITYRHNSMKNGVWYPRNIRRYTGTK